ncbi:MAG: lipopolysaccharide biosynthesis protein [Bacteroidia bacterium]
MLKKLFTSTVLYTIGGLLPMLSGLILLFPYTQQLMPADYGALAIFISFTAFIQIILNYGIDNFIAIYYFEHKDDPEGLRKFVGTIVALLIIIGCVFALIMAVSGNLLFLFPAFKNKGLSFYPFGFMSVLTAFCNVIFKTYTTLLIYRQQQWRFLWFNLINFIATIIISLIGLEMYPHSIIGPMWGRLLSGVVIFLLALSFYLVEYGIAFDKTMLSGWQKFCTPVVIFSLLTWIMSYVNSYILYDLSDVGIYGFAMQCTLLIEFTQNGLVSVINPKIYLLLKDGNLTRSTPEENKYHHLFTLATILLIAITIFLLPILITLVVKNKTYYASFYYLPYVAGGYVFRVLYNLFILQIYYRKKTKLLPRLFSISSLAQIVFGIIFIKYFGLWGAVWSALLIKPLQVILLWIGARKMFAYKFNVIKLVALPVIYLIGIIVIYQLAGTANYLIPGSLQLLLAIILILIAFRNEIPQMTLLLKKNSK